MTHYASQRDLLDTANLDFDLCKLRDVPDEGVIDAQLSLVSKLEYAGGSEGLGYGPNPKHSIGVRDPLRYQVRVAVPPAPRQFAVHHQTHGEAGQPMSCKLLRQLAVQRFGKPTREIVAHGKLSRKYQD